MSINERIKLVIKMHNLSPSAFADKIGVQRSNVSHVLSGRNKPGVDFLEKVVHTFPRVNAYWLLTGKNLEQDDQEFQENKKINPLQLIETVPKPENINRSEAEIERIVIFYSNGSFKAYANDGLPPNQ